MALLYHDLRALLEAQKRGASFSSVLTVGRLAIYLHPREVRSIGGLPGYRFGEYSERFFRDRLGTSELVTLDHSDYEGASRIHDMNRPLPQDLEGRFDAVIDAGSLEHIFNVPVAFANVMRAVVPGGSVFITTPTNNLCGHGFYQFSPELMFRIFSIENGFEIREVTLLRAPFPSIESVPVRRVYRVTDPMESRGRVGLQASDVAMLHVEARKVSDVVPFSTYPQQSDYQALWSGHGLGVASASRRALKKFVEMLPRPLELRLKGYNLRHRFSYWNRRFFERLR